MVDLDELSHPEPPIAGDETATLLGSLERQRATLAWKCGGLDAAGMRARLAPGAMTLGGLLKHLALVEDDYFSGRLLGRPRSPPFALWQDAVARSRSAVAEALAVGGLGQLARRSWPDGQAPSLRRILVDLIEEYARHVGHADLIRESVDGLVGEDPPRESPSSS